METKLQSSYNEKRTFSDKFERQIKAILGGVFFQNEIHKDIHEATDLLILSIKAKLTFACRVRRNKYFDAFKNEFTIRKLENKSEIEKIINGFADYLFYGFCSEDEKNIVYYHIIDLDVFRKYCNLDRKLHDNKDGTYFYSFKFAEFPLNLIKYKWRKLCQ